MRKEDLQSGKKKKVNVAGARGHTAYLNTGEMGGLTLERNEGHQLPQHDA